MTALSIYRAALEKIAGDAAPDSNGNCEECRWPITLVGLLDVHSADCKSWLARAALEAAAKAPGIAEDPELRRLLASNLAEVGATLVHRVEAALCAIDAYQRGTK